MQLEVVRDSVDGTNTAAKRLSGIVPPKVIVNKNFSHSKFSRGDITPLGES